LAKVHMDDYSLFFTPPVLEGSIPSEAMSLRRIVVGPLNPFIRTALTFPIAAARAHLDVLHVQYIAPPLCPVPFIVSVHDVAYERYPQFFTPRDVKQLRVSIPLSIRNASAVLTLSEYSKNDIIRRYKTPEDKIVVAPCAADPMYRVLHDAACDVDQPPGVGVSGIGDTRRDRDPDPRLEPAVAVSIPNCNPATNALSYEGPRGTLPPDVSIHADGSAQCGRRRSRGRVYPRGPASASRDHNAPGDDESNGRAEGEAAETSHADRCFSGGKASHRDR